MNVLCLQQSSIFEAYGGIEYYLHDFLTLSSDILGTNRVVTMVPQRSTDFSCSPTRYKVICVPQKRRGFLRKLENRFSPRLFSEAKQTAQKNNTSLIIAGHVSLAPMALALSKSLGIPYWTIAYGLEVWGGMRTQDSWALRKSDKIISISNWTRNILEARGYSPERISVVHPCLSPDFNQIPIRNGQKAANRPLNILTVSRLDASEQYKGHDHVIQALAMIMKSHPESVPFYTIQGTGNDKERLEHLVFYYGLQDWVTFLDKVETRVALVSIYQDHDLFVMPSRFGCWSGKWKGEGFGMVYIEAGACGLPSVAYDCGGATDIIRTGENGVLVKPDNVEELAKTFLSLTNDRTLLSELGRKAKQTAVECFSSDAIRNELEPLLLSGQSVAKIRPSTDSVNISH
ncbi:MAG: glycosyltransferase family 1 protein [Proteobacteria bacterium]|nr:glycosyltransferase family 1 protein [Pseudomonadota bacterium]NDC23180.1 glycosyltransferase family 1 protein [Pseudomonadota bacterium]NDD03355.1 glycosyltransferase family 1 protein [Pseudomonadota bacterium]NDG26244.1 glycosyltransferase family 1 protein [Pseudomonadota bacterium]